MSTKTQKGTALVTGGAVRIGRALCLTLGQQGYTVAIHYRGSADSASDLADDITANGGKGDSKTGHKSVFSESER